MLKHLRNLVSPPGVEQRAVLLAGKHIPYTLKRSNRRRSIGLRIDDGGLSVSVPLRASEKWLHSVLQDKAHWVVEKLDGWQTRKPIETRWADGEAVSYLGELLTLRVKQSLFTAPAHRRGNELWVFVVNGSETAHIEQAVSRWYRQEAEQLFARRTAHGSVRLNVQLIKLPPHLIDYVVVHELAHLRELNHSAAFWNVVGSVCPDYARLRRELKAVAL